MWKNYPFVLKHSKRSQLRTFSLVLAGAICLLSSSLSLMHLPVQATTFTHGCAPNTPPPVAGTLVSPPSTPGSVWINEVLSNPKSVWNCSEPAGSFSSGTDSWIELYNPQSEALNLYAVHAEISLDGGTSWYTLPSGSAIAPGGFLVVFPLEGVVSPPPTWNVVLAFASLNSIIDQANIPALQQDQSYARVPDGSSNWQFVGTPTIDASNNASDQPVTTTPTKTSVPTKTPKPNRGPGSGSAGSTGVTPPVNTGTQPAGNQLQLPPSVTSISQTSDTTATSAFGQSLVSTSNNPLDIWHIVMLIALFLLFGGALTWCWRLFRAQ